MTEKTEKRLTVRIPEDLHRKARVKCAETGRTLSEVVRDALRKWVEDSPEQPEDKPVT